MATKRFLWCFAEMKKAKCLPVVFILLSIVLFMKYVMPSEFTRHNSTGDDGLTSKRIVENKYSLAEPDEIHLSVVVCGVDRVEEAIVMLKSALIFTHRHITVHIFTDEQLKPFFIQQLKTWPELALNKLTYNLYSIEYPTVDDIKQEAWRKLFKPCASQRLFIPDILTDVEKILYVDTDVLFLRHIDDLWQYFSHFNDTNIIALSPDNEDPSVTVYNRLTKHPYYGTFGVNSGVMLMNLNRMRSLDWVNFITAYYKEYKSMMKWGSASTGTSITCNA